MTQSTLTVLTYSAASELERLNIADIWVSQPLATSASSYISTLNCNSSKTARDNEDSENSEDSKGGRDGGVGGDGGYIDPADWRVGRILSALTACLPFVFEPERIVVDNSEIIQAV